jgi:hypothetical protein
LRKFCKFSWIFKIQKCGGFPLQLNNH